MSRENPDAARTLARTATSHSGPSWRRRAALLEDLADPVTRRRSAVAEPELAPLGVPVEPPLAQVPMFH